MKICCFLIFSFFLLSTVSSQTVIADSINSPLPKVTCDCILTCDKVGILTHLYTKLMSEENKVEYTKEIIREMQGWVKNWGGDLEPDTPNTKTSATPVPLPAAEATPPVPIPDNKTESVNTTTNVTTTTNITTSTNLTTTTSADIPLTTTSKPPNSPPENSSPIVTTTRRTVNAVKTEDNKHFYQSTFFFALIFLSIMILISIYFCYVSRRKIRVYLNKNMGVGRNNKPYGRVPNLEEAMPSFAEVKS